MRESHLIDYQNAVKKRMLENQHKIDFKTQDIFYKRLKQSSR